MTRGKVTVESALEQWLEPGKRYLMAVSGGIDSMVLAHGAVSVRNKKGLELGVCHVDHGLRSESSLEREHVIEFCQINEVPCYVTELKPPTNENLEAWGRRERYQFFSFILERDGYDEMLTAHHANDVAETLLIRLVSNKELGSILRRDQRRRCLRPLLSVARNGIERYAKEHSVEFCEDLSNEDQNFLRNRVRHTLLPVLQEHFDPRIEEILSDRAAALAEDINGLYTLANDTVFELGSLQWGSKDWYRAVRQRLTAKTDAVAWRVTELLLEQQIGFRVGRHHSWRAMQVLLGNQVGTELPGGYALRRKDSGVELNPSQSNSNEV